jgi:D-tyrosyl-tRNA(Tyr) deacylase
MALGMRALVQRVSEAGVTIAGKKHGAIERGLLILLGVGLEDTQSDAAYLARRCSALRIFEDAEGKMNLSLKETAGAALVVSQFTLYADTRKGNRPNFLQAARPEAAEPLYESFLDALRKEMGPDRVHSGVFSAMMDISLVNEGPVTVMLESNQ